MSKSHITPEKLVATGSIVPKLHYGPYLRDWWIFSKETAQDKHYPIPLRLGLKVMIQLNNNPFIIRIVHISSNAVWNKTGVLMSILGDTLFVINHSITLDKIN
ncbi:hypothetical protein RhiirC2_784977 [Rhizophagus irregularis]|uniref:Uncharacterized protein n=1 Tax=Rhizophagus irregularis TaxID=588596 RepID=A0A2N1MXI2_9GLOM|nr:hypothetical protein RhiirC2_784977 [Rhizophagus irregularis]